MASVASYLGPAGIELLGLELQRAHRAFPRRAFCRIANTGISHLGLFARATHIARALDSVLELPFRRVAKIVVAAAGPVRESSGYGPMENFRLLALTRFVSLAGGAHFRDSMWALRELTKRFTSEFDVRPFLVQAQKDTLEIVCEWAHDQSLHVRRLASEGTRSRLPWGTHLKTFQRNPSLALSVIERLKTDESRYVQVSVANNLADIIKDDEEFGLNVAERWAATEHPVTLRIVSHAVRFPATKGLKRAIALRCGPRDDGRRENLSGMNAASRPSAKGSL
jgi:3-methyladenine DNA glycosylase AlkC